MDTKQIHSVERKIGDPVVRFETGRLASLADGAVMAQVGDTTILVAVTAAKAPREGTDFFPLTVDIEERMYAAGKIPGGFFRREGRASEKAILTCRLIDRPLRPCFPDGFRNDVHVVGIIQAVDGENPSDILAINAASAALMVSGIPFEGPVGAVRLANIDGDWVANATYQQAEDATFEIVVAGRRNAAGEADILMVEAGATERALDLVAEGAPEITEEVVGAGLEEAKTHILEVISLQEELVQAAGVKQQATKWVVEGEPDAALYARVKELAAPSLEPALTIAEKVEREDKIRQVGESISETMKAEFPERSAK